MEIRLSRYNRPFVEPSSSEIHYISLDDQRDMKIGLYSAHVREFYLLPRVNLFEVYDPITRATYKHDLNNLGFHRPFSSQPVNSLEIDRDFLAELRSSGIKAAGNLLSVCVCKRPWRCVCNKQA